MFDSDETIAAEVQYILDRNLSLPHGAVTVDVQNGWVILTGSVEWEFQRGAAEAGILQYSGARGIFNELTVKPEAGTSLDDEGMFGAGSRMAA